MVYVDENGKILDSVDLTLGYLVDEEWEDHPQQQQEGHYEYEDNEAGCRTMTFVVDKEAKSAWREVTVQKYVLYTEDELVLVQKADYGKRLDEIEDGNYANRLVALEDAGYAEQISELKDDNTFLAQCLLEMSELVYA